MKTVGEDSSAITATGLRRLLRGLDVQINRAMRASLDPVGLTVDEWTVLCALNDGAGHTMAEVIEAAGVPGPTATRMVDKLVSNALLHRGVDPADRRKVLVILSPRGQELYARLAPNDARIADLLRDRIGHRAATELETRLSEATASLALESDRGAPQ